MRAYSKIYQLAVQRAKMITRAIAWAVAQLRALDIPVIGSSRDARGRPEHRLESDRPGHLGPDGRQESSWPGHTPLKWFQ